MNNSIVYKRFIRVIILIILLFSATNISAQEKVTLQLKWTHAFQFAGYYAAVEQGYYGEAGLEVTIEEASPDINVVGKVLDDKAQYGVGSSGLLLERASGKPVVVLAVLFQQSPYEIYASPEIKHLNDLIGKRLMIEPQAEELIAYLKKEGVSIDSVRNVPHNYNTSELIKGTIDAMSGYVSSEPYHLEKAKYPYRTFSPRSAGIDFYGDNLFTSEQELKQHPKRVKAFRAASIRGWQYAKEHPNEIIELIISRYSKQKTYDYLRFEAEQTIPLLQPALIDIGYMSLNRWQHIAQTYADIGLLPADYSLDGFIYDADEVNLSWFYGSLGMALLIICCVSILAFYIYRINKRLSQNIRESNKTTAALIENKQKYEDLVNTSHSLIWMCDLEAKFTYLNPAWEETHGYKIEEMLGKPFSDFQRPEIFARDMLEFTRHLEGGSVRNYETSHLCKDGTEISLVFNAIPLKDNSGTIIGTQGTAYDITDRVKYERLLQEEKERAEESVKKFRTIFNEAPTGIALTDSVTGYIYDVNPMYAKIIGRTVEEIKNMDWMSITHPDDIKADMDNMALINKGEINSFQMEKRYLHSNGSVVWINLTVAALNVTNTEAKQHLAMVEDITERKQTEEQIRKLSRAVEQSPATVVITDLKGDIEYVNPKFTETTGYSFDEAIAKNPRVLKSDEKSSEEYSELWETITSGKEWRGEFHNKKKNGELYWEFASISPIRNDKGISTHFIAIKEDITKRKQAEDELIKNEVRLRELNATKDKFFSIIAHDLKSPFNSIIGFSDVLIDKVKEKDYSRIEEYSAIIQQSSERAMDLLINLMEWSQSQTGRMEFSPEYFEIVELINDVIELLNDSAQQKSITISGNLSHTATVFVDKAMISTVLRNLISNAIKFSNTGGEIVISVEQKQKELVLAVKDFGVGIEESDIDKLFRIDENLTTKGTQNEKGTGLGLILCKDFIKKHKGEIWVESEVGEGSTFYFTIPES